MKEFLTDAEVRKYIDQVKNGNNDAWAILCDNFSEYIHKIAWKRLSNYNISSDRKHEIEQDLYQAGWQGFIKALKEYDSDKNTKFITYVTYYIDPEIASELDVQLNVLGLTNRPKKEIKGTVSSKSLKVDIDDERSIMKNSRHSKLDESISVPKADDLGKYSTERRTLQLLEILKLLTDENHTLSKDELKRMLVLYRIAKYQNGTKPESDNTLTSSIEEILMEINPSTYSEENDRDYLIRYEGYKENRLTENKEKTGICLYQFDLIAQKLRQKIYSWKKPNLVMLAMMKD